MCILTIVCRLSKLHVNNIRVFYIESIDCKLHFFRDNIPTISLSDMKINSVFFCCVINWQKMSIFFHSAVFEDCYDTDFKVQSSISSSFLMYTELHFPSQRLIFHTSSRAEVFTAQSFVLLTYLYLLARDTKTHTIILILVTFPYLGSAVEDNIIIEYDY